jgi:hypothetical protein
MGSALRDDRVVGCLRSLPERGGELGKKAGRHGDPVVTKTAPRRNGKFYAVLYGTGFATQIPSPSLFAPGSSRTDANVGTTVGVNIYVTPSFALTGGLGYDFDNLQDPSMPTVEQAHSLILFAGFGLRSGDSRFDISYELTARDQNIEGPPVRWGSLRGSAFLVFGRRAYLEPWARAFDGGGGAGLEGAFYFSQRTRPSHLDESAPRAALRCWGSGHLGQRGRGV